MPTGISKIPRLHAVKLLQKLRLLRQLLRLKRGKDVDTKAIVGLAFQLVRDMVNKYATENPATDKWDMANQLMPLVESLLKRGGLMAAEGEPTEVELLAGEIVVQIEAAMAEAGS